MHTSRLPVGWALTGAKANEREVLAQIIDTTPALMPDRDRPQIVIADKGYNGAEFEASLTAARINLLRPTCKGEKPRPGQRFFKPLRQVVESVNQTLKGQLDIERHEGRTIAGVCTRIAQRVLALAAAIWHNDNLGHRVKRSLIAYDH